MHIILVSDRMATAKTVTLKARHLIVAMFGVVVAVISLSSLFSFVTLRHATELRLPFMQEMLLSVRHEESKKTQEFMRQNVDAMATRIGQLQAQMIRLDSLGERVGGLVGIKPQELKTTEQPGRGGALVQPVRSLSAEELHHQLDLMTRQVESRREVMSMIETELLDERARRSLVPTTLPIEASWNASGFGWRIDPLTGQHAMHEGVDFVADTGTPIVAAASGIVVAAEHHPAYGKMVEIDHGNDLTTRYAHTSKLLVKVGAVVKRGHKIAEVGSTGRSTGPHLHFEVRKADVAVNPNRFLQQAKNSSPLVAERSR